MSAVQIQGNASGTGTLTIAAPNTNTNRTLTLPDDTGTLISTGSTFAGTGPAFSAYITTNQSITNSTFVKVQLNAEEFDTNSNFDSTTNYRFTPTVAGYYQLNAGINLSGTAITVAIGSLFKNGSEYKRGNQIPVVSASTVGVVISSIVYFNGSTDYAEIYAYSSATSANVVTGGSGVSYFNGAMVRAA